MSIYRFLRNLATIIFLSSLSLACAVALKNSEKQSLAQNAVPNIEYGDIILQNKSEYIIIPVGLTISETKSLPDFDISSKTYYIRESFYSNMIFYNVNNGQSHLLLNKSLPIAHWEFLQHKNEKGQILPDLILFTLIESDTNQDKRINREDATVAYMADSSGKKVQQLTPKNHRVVNWKIDKNTGLIFLRTMKDSDKDKKFTERDEVTFFMVRINKPAMGIETVNQKIRQAIKSNKIINVQPRGGSYDRLG